MKLLVHHTKYELYCAYAEISIGSLGFFMRLKTRLNANRITTAFFYRYRHKGNLLSVYFSQLNRHTDSKYYCIF